MFSPDLQSFLSAIESTELPKDRDVEHHVQALKDRLRCLAEYPTAFEALESEHGIAKQYEQRAEILRAAGLTTDIHDNAVAYPSYDQVRARMLEHPNLLQKMQQGFTRVQPVPFGVRLRDFFPPLRAALRKYAGVGTLRGTDGAELSLDQEELLRAWGVYEDAEITGELVYAPKAFHRDPGKHGGKTKAALLTEDPSSSIQVHLTENLPHGGRGETIGGRPQLVIKTAKDCLAKLGKAPYGDEAGYTPEAELSHLLTHLHETEGEVPDNYLSVTGSTCICTGAWVPSQERVPCVYFFPDPHGGQLRVSKISADVPCNSNGTRS